MKLIPKDALVAEIEKRIVEYKDMKIDSSYYEGMVASLEFFRDEFINTLEVKEVDLDTDFGVSWGEYCDCGGNINDYKVAKHFFELGMSVSNKAQKGEKV